MDSYSALIIRRLIKKGLKPTWKPEDLKGFLAIMANLKGQVDEISKKQPTFLFEHCDPEMLVTLVVTLEEQR